MSRYGKENDYEKSYIIFNCDSLANNQYNFDISIRKAYKRIL